MSTLRSRRPSPAMVVAVDRPDRRAGRHRLRRADDQRRRDQEADDRRRQAEEEDADRLPDQHQQARRGAVGEARRPHLLGGRQQPGRPRQRDAGPGQRRRHHRRRGRRRRRRRLPGQRHRLRQRRRRATTPAPRCPAPATPRPTSRRRTPTRSKSAPATKRRQRGRRLPPDRRLPVVSGASRATAMSTRSPRKGDCPRRRGVGAGGRPWRASRRRGPPATRAGRARRPRRAPLPAKRGAPGETSP